MGFGFCTRYHKVKRFIDVLKRIAPFLQKQEKGAFIKAYQNAHITEKNHPRRTLMTSSTHVKFKPASLIIYLCVRSVISCLWKSTAMIVNDLLLLF